MINLPLTCKIYTPPPKLPTNLISYSCNWTQVLAKSNLVANEASQIWFLECSSSLSEGLSTEGTIICATHLYNIMR